MMLISMQWINSLSIQVKETCKEVKHFYINQHETCGKPSAQYSTQVEIKIPGEKSLNTMAAVTAQYWQHVQYRFLWHCPHEGHSMQQPQNPSFGTQDSNPQLGLHSLRRFPLPHVLYLTSGVVVRSNLACRLSSAW